MIGLTDKKLSASLHGDILKENIHFLQVDRQQAGVSKLNASWTN